MPSKTFLLVLSSLVATSQSHLLRSEPLLKEQQSLALRVTQHVSPSFTSFVQIDADRSLTTRSNRLENQADPAPDAVSGSNVGQYGVDDALNNVRLVVEKNTGFALPVKSVDPEHPCPSANPCEKELTPLERKVKDAEAQVTALAKTRKIEAETLESRIRREQEITDAAIEKQLTTQEQLSADEQKMERLQHLVEQAKVAANKRKELLVDPNHFTDSCAPGFRVYFNGQAKDRMTYDDKKVLSKALKDRHCKETDLLCICDMAKKQNIKSILGKVNAGVDCECYQGMAKEIREEEAQRTSSEEEAAKQEEEKEPENSKTTTISGDASSQ